MGVKTKKKSLIVFLSVIVLAFLVAACQSSLNTGVNLNLGGGNNTPSSSGEGRGVFAIKDAAANMESVTSVKMTVDSVKVHSATEGWTTVSSTPKTYDLMQLRAEGKQELLADANLKAGTYDQMRLDVSNVVVTDESGKHEAKLPSGELKIVGNMVVDANSTSTATFDFVADESLHVTGNGKYIMAPVMQVETRENADTEVTSDNDVKIKGGHVNTNIKVGMDINGNVGVGLRIPSNANLTLDTSGIVKVGGKSSGSLGVGAGGSAEA